ncbi:MAG: glycosyltransferase family 2 protein [Ruminococcus sp.]
MEKTIAKQLLVGIIVPVYNVEEYVSRCLDSLLSNTYKNFLVFCVDDGSTDNSAAVVEEYAKKDKRIILRRQENQGVSAARNTGMKAAFEKDCDVIGFVDPDDWVHPQYIEILLSGIMDGYDISICEYFRTDKYENSFSDIKKYNKTELQTYEIEDYYVNQLWDKFYRSSLLKKLTFKNLDMREDTLFNISLMTMNSFKMCYIPEKLYYHFNRQGSLFNTFNEKYGLVFSREIINILKSNKCRDSMKTFLVDKGLKKCMECRYYSKFTNEYKKYKAEYNNLMKEIWKIAKEQKIKIKNKLLLKLFTVFPSLYRLFRIVNDRTMLGFEKNQKERMRNEKAM